MQFSINTTFNYDLNAKTKQTLWLNCIGLHYTVRVPNKVDTEYTCSTVLLTNSLKKNKDFYVQFVYSNLIVKK